MLLIINLYYSDVKHSNSKIFIQKYVEITLNVCVQDRSGFYNMLFCIKL